MNTFIDMDILLDGLTEKLSKDQLEAVRGLIGKTLRDNALKVETMGTVLETFDNLLTFDLDLLGTSPDTIPKFQYLEKQCYALYTDELLMADSRIAGEVAGEDELKSISNIKYVEDMLRSIDSVKWEGHSYKFSEGKMFVKGGFRYGDFTDNPKEHMDMMAKGVVTLNETILDKITNKTVDKFVINLEKTLDVDKLVERYNLYVEELVQELKQKVEDLFLTDSQIPQEYYFEDTTVLFPKYFYDEKESLLEIFGHELYERYATRFIKDKTLIDEVKDQLDSTEMVDGIEMFAKENDSTDDESDGVLTWGGKGDDAWSF